jgi:hypothetical protein
MRFSYDRAKHVVEVDERILAVFIVDSTSNTLNIRFEEKNESTKDQPLGQHLWDILEYDKVRLIKIYESERLIVVLAKSHSSPGDIANTVLGYLYESEDEQPKSLF